MLYIIYSINTINRIYIYIYIYIYITIQNYNFDNFCAIYKTKAFFKIRVPLPWKLTLIGFEPAFLKVLCIDSCLS